MEKKIIGAIAFAVIVVAAGWNYKHNSQNVELSDLALANIEAMANDMYESKYCNNSGYACIIKYSDGTSTTIWNHWN